MAAALAVVPRRGPRPGQHPRGRPGAAGRQPLGRQPDAGHARCSRSPSAPTSASSAPSTSWPTTSCSRCPALSLPAQVRHGGRLARERRRRRCRPAPRCSSTRAATTRSTGPSWERNRVDFGGRKGFIRLALEQDVPIVPVVSIGGQETALFLTRGERPGAAARPRPHVPPEGAADLARAALGAERRRHARPHPAAGEDHRRGAAADPPARGVRPRARRRRGLRPRHAARCRTRSTRWPPSGACRCSDEGRRAIEVAAPPRGGVGVRLRPDPLPALHVRRHALGGRRPTSRAAAAPATGCCCASARPRSAG